MIKLMKYEFRKTLGPKVILLGLCAILEVSFLFSLWTGNENLNAISIMLLTFLALIGIAVIGLYSIITLHHDMNSRQSYMLFMTPNSCYKILGAKMLENAISLLLASAFFFGLGLLDITLLLAKYGVLQELWDFITSALKAIRISASYGVELDTIVNVPTVAAFTANIVANWIATVTTANLAVIIAAALLNNKRGNGFISFILMIVILSAYSNVVSYIMNAAQLTLVPYFLVSAVIALIFSGVVYFCSAMIMERKLSV